jgi:hypothetical protein
MMRGQQTGAGSPMKSDLQLARELLIGYLEPTQGRSRRKYLKGPKEDEARKALARLLRSDPPLDRELRQHLADLVDPPAWQQRKLQFRFLRQGNVVDHIAKTEVVRHVQVEFCATKHLTRAYESAALRFSISEELVKRLWESYRHVYGQDLEKVLAANEQPLPST